MKSIKLKWGITLCCSALALVLGSFALGRMSAHWEEAPSAPAESLSPDLRNGDSVLVLPSPPADTAVSMPQPSPSLEPGGYTLRLSRGSLEVLSGSVLISRFDPPPGLNEEENALLEQGMDFETLENIEQYLESFDS
jgi:hypothetical protein